MTGKSIEDLFSRETWRMVERQSLVLIVGEVFSYVRMQQMNAPPVRAWEDIIAGRLDNLVLLMSSVQQISRTTPILKDVSIYENTCGQGTT